MFVVLACRGCYHKPGANAHMFAPKPLKTKCPGDYYKPGASHAGANTQQGAKHRNMKVKTRKMCVSAETTISKQKLTTPTTSTTQSESHDRGSRVTKHGRGIHFV